MTSPATSTKPILALTLQSSPSSPRKHTSVLREETGTTKIPLSWEFLLWLSGLRTQHGVPADVGLIPGLAQWVKDPLLAAA